MPLRFWVPAHDSGLTFLRLDVELAMQMGTRTLFRDDEVPVHPVLCDPDISSEMLPTALRRMPLIMSDLFKFSNVLNEAEKGYIPKVDPIDYTETILSLLYCLVEALPLEQISSKPGGLFEEGTYLVMLAYMTTLLPEYSRDGSSCPLLSIRLQSALQTLYVTTSESSGSDLYFLLWCLFTSGISVLGLTDDPWLSRLIANTCERLGLENWAAIQRQLSQFPWIFVLHEVPGHRLWEAVRLMNKDFICGS